MKRTIGATAVIACLLLVPAVALAEISVQLDNHGQFKKYFYLTQGEGRSGVVWGQMRGHVPLHLMLNPLGDNLGDLAPRVTTHPTTGFPWVVWSKNVANQKRIAWSAWDGERWTEPTFVVGTVDPFGYDQLDPQLTFDLMGRPFLTWSVEATTSHVYVSAMVAGVWTKPVRVSDAEVDSRRPSAKHGPNYAAVTYDTPSGPLTRVIPSVMLLDDAGIMDNPIPPGVTGDTDDGPTWGAGGDGDKFILRR